MHAVIRLNSFDPHRLSGAGDQIDRFDRLHAAQPGYAGSVVVDLGWGRRLAVNLWDSQDASESALAVLVPEVDRLLVPLMSAPSQFLGAGPVLRSDVGRSAGD